MPKKETWSKWKITVLRKLDGVPLSCNVLRKLDWGTYKLASLR